MVDVPDDAPLAAIPLDEPADPMPRRTWPQLVSETVQVLPNLLKLLVRLLRDRRVPVRRKVVAGVVFGYLVSPVDLIPDVVPVLGQVDDVLLVAFALNHLFEGIDRDVVLEYWDGSQDAFELVDAVTAWGAGLLPARVRHLLT